MKKILFGIIGMVLNYTVSAVPLTHQVGIWHFDEEFGQQVLDSSRFVNHGTFGSATGVTWITRRFDTGALRFNGTSFVKVPYSAALEPQHLSVEAWVRRLNSPGTYKFLVSKSQDAACTQLAYGLYTGEGTLGLTFYIDNGHSSGYHSPEVNQSYIWNGNWHHVVGTYDGNWLKLYVDGVQVGTGTPVTTTIDYSAFPYKELYIGDYGGGVVSGCVGMNFDGDIDDVRIWNRALTPLQVKKRHRGY